MFTSRAPFVRSLFGNLNSLNHLAHGPVRAGKSVRRGGAKTHLKPCWRSKTRHPAENGGSESSCFPDWRTRGITEYWNINFLRYNTQKSLSAIL